MTAEELHAACYAAVCECPQFEQWDDDSQFAGYGEFGSIPRKGLYHVVKFWREHGELLWEYGYDQALSSEARELFEEIDQVIDDAIRNHFKMKDKP